MKRALCYLLITGAADGQNWLTYSGNMAGHRYSPLAQITRDNVSKLRPVWIHQVDDPNKIETSPLVRDGIVYITEPPSNAAALDARTGRPLWRYRRALPKEARNCCGQVNRGLAILGDTLYLGTLDARLVALDARTGVVKWETEIADYKIGYSITAAPLVVKDKVIVGVSGGEYGIRGHIDAIDAKTGKRAWRFWTVAGPGEPGNETWAGDSWKAGAAGAWVTGSYDPELSLIYWSTGNPGPDWNGDGRAGDNLYSDSLLALDADTGKLKWHFQFTPHDVHDWDSNQTPVLINSGGRKLAVTANRNGFYYVLDRETGRFLRAREYVKQTWAVGMDEKGRPIRKPGTFPTKEGVEVYPDVNGGTNWFSPSYSPQTNLFYVAAREGAGIYFTAEAIYKPGASFVGGGWKLAPQAEHYGAVRALDPVSGERKWEFRLVSKPWAGVMSTAGGLVFGGSDEGSFFALDAHNGKPLWNFPTGGKVYANPVSFEHLGKQYILIAAGHGMFAFALEN